MSGEVDDKLKFSSCNQQLKLQGLVRRPVPVLAILRRGRYFTVRRDEKAEKPVIACLALEQRLPENKSPASLPSSPG